MVHRGQRSGVHHWIDRARQFGFIRRFPSRQLKRLDVSALHRTGRSRNRTSMVPGSAIYPITLGARLGRQHVRVLFRQVRR